MTPRRFTRLLAAWLCAGTLTAGAGDGGFALRVVGLGGSPERADVREHARFCREIGFNGFWVRDDDAGSWHPAAAGSPATSAAWRAWRARESARVFVVLDPLRAADGFRLPDRGLQRRLLRFVRQLRRSGVGDFVLDFSGDPPHVVDLSEALRLGGHPAAVQLDLIRRLHRGLRDDERLWVLPPFPARRSLTAAPARYRRALAEGFATLPPTVGIVWRGPEAVAPEIAAGDLDIAFDVYGRRPLLLLDAYPYAGENDDLALALNLAPLQRRSPRLASAAAGYVSLPMRDLAGSRLALLSIADFLRAPRDYDPLASSRAAQRRLAGDDPDARRDLATQVLEWGGWIGERNYRPGWLDNPRSAATALRNPALIARWGWTRRRYPDRLLGVGRIEDRPFRDALVARMERRHAIARAMPLAAEVRARRSAGRRDVAPLLDSLRRLRAESGSPAAIDAFLAAAGIALD